MARQAAISLPPDIQQAIEEWRVSMPVPPSKSAAMVALIRAGLKALAPETLAGKGD
jgi:hypothetical protein